MDISFIIPAYNASLYIKECVESILNLFSSDIEIIVIDDGSVDNTAEVVRENLDLWNRKEEVVKLIVQQNRGVSAARNTALGYVSKTWVTFIDADDLLTEYFKDAVSLAEPFANETDLYVFGMWQSAKRNTSKMAISRKSPSESTFRTYQAHDYELLMKNVLAFVDKSEKLCNLNLASVCGKLYKYSSTAGRTAFPLGVRNGEDLLFNLAIYEMKPTVMMSDIPVYLYFRNTSSLTHRFKPDMEEITESFFNNLAPIVKRHSALCPLYHRSVVNNFFIECNHYLFHKDNKQSFSIRYRYFMHRINSFYKDSFKEVKGKFIHSHFNYVLFILLKKKLYMCVFIAFVMKSVTKSILCR